MSHRLTAFTEMQNLLSEHYSEAFGYPALPFNFRSGVKITLGGESWEAEVKQDAALPGSGPWLGMGSAALLVLLVGVVLVSLTVGRCMSRWRG